MEKNEIIRIAKVIKDAVTDAASPFPPDDCWYRITDDWDLNIWVDMGERKYTLFKTKDGTPIVTEEGVHV